MKKKILILHTTGDWWESRYHYKQLSALKDAKFEVIHIIKKQKLPNNLDYKTILVNKKFIRKTGGINLLYKVLKTNVKNVQICNVELLPLGIILSVFFKRNVFYDCIEDHFHSILHSKTSLPKFLRIILAYYVKALEQISSKTFKGFILSDPYLYKTHNISKCKKMIFYNMPPQTLLKNYSPNTVKHYDLVVLGSMSIRTGVLDVIKAVKILNDKNIKVNLKLIGNPFLDYELAEELNDILKDKELDKLIYITGKIPFENAISELKECKIGIIPLLDLPKFQNNIAMKQWEYMAFNMPVIASNLRPQNFFIKEDVNGFFYTPNKIYELVSIIKNLIESPELIHRIGNNGRKLVLERWNAESQQQKFIKFYKLRMDNKNYNETQIPPFDF